MEKLHLKEYLNLSPENIASGVSVGGVVGTAQTLSSHTVKVYTNVGSSSSSYPKSSTITVIGGDGVVQTKTVTTFGYVTFENVAGGLIWMNGLQFLGSPNCNNSWYISGLSNYTKVRTVDSYYYDQWAVVGVATADTISIKYS